jgi:putative two-component system response regulator
MNYAVPLEDLVKTLLRMAEYHEKESAWHSQGSCAYALTIGKRLGLSEEELSFLKFAAQIHDIGKIGIDPLILRQAAPLTAGQLAQVRMHATIGYDMLEFARVPHQIREAVLHHHEHWDGTGYPDGKAGKAIPLFARIVTMADVWDAITSNRPYRPAMPFEKALLCIDQHATWFDPEIFATWLDVLRKEDHDVGGT